VVGISDINSTPARQILLDRPTTTPALGYRQIGSAFATIIRESEPRFAIGIFGGWGSGKTTLMNAIKTALQEDSLVIVDFNAWRFEREPQLLIPLLDTIRGALVRWSEPRDVSTREKMRSVANRIGRVVRALATGVSAEVGLPGAAKVSYDIGTALDALSAPGEPGGAQSLYVAAFQELERAFSEFSAGGITRVVVFVDDLDRCLPGNALDLLESIKLFFDLRGFIFVVGLDEDVVQRAIRTKFAEQDDHPLLEEARSSAAAAMASQRLSREYVKKIFQVPYSLPAMVPQQLDDLLAAMYREADLGAAQLGDLRGRVRPYLEYVAVERRVNPREVKRFINAYILQTLVRPELDPDTVLALQTLVFRYEWKLLYNAIFTDSALFMRALGEFRGGEDSAFKDLSPGLAVLHPSLADYLRSDLAGPLIRHDSLDNYLSSLQSTRSAGAWASEAYRLMVQLRREVNNALSGNWAEVRESVIGTAMNTVASLNDLLRGTSTSEISTSLFVLPRQLSDRTSELAKITHGPERPTHLLIPMRDIVDRAVDELQRLSESPAFQV
jgi:hypothetical protein